MSHLKYLILGWHVNITIEGLAQLPGLTYLDLARNNTIQDSHFARLSPLRALILDSNRTVDGTELWRLANSLQSLSLVNNGGVMANELSQLTGLTSLDIRSFTLDDVDLMKLSNLTSLTLRDNPRITDKGLETLSNLTKLDLESDKNITTAGLSPLRHLRWLDVRSAPLVTSEVLDLLPNLQYLACDF